MQLANTEEFIDGALTGNLGEVLIRLVMLCTFDIMTTRNQRLWEANVFSLFISSQGRGYPSLWSQVLSGRGEPQCLVPGLFQERGLTLVVSKVLPGRGVRQPNQDRGYPPTPPKGMFATPRTVSLLRSGRMTFLFIKM